MKIATWNVNSVRARQQRLLDWLQQVQPDVLCLQELKTKEESFPYESIREAGYHAAVFGQKTYNGVAVLSRTPPSQIECGWGHGGDDQQARLIAVEVGGVRVISAYVPNGEQVGSAKYVYKLDWMGRLRSYLESRYTPTTPLVLCGDFNVARDDLDVAHPVQWANSVLCYRSARLSLDRILDWGLVDVFRQRHPEGGLYSWWDYRMLAFPKNDGLRLDYIFATDPLAQRCTCADVDREQRKGEKPSDHAPVVVSFAD
ncbi:MAG: exodeoxyribonuclease III [Planctomycetota bacterium]|nr:exodeoxyribonuclease III [Planctomycetota bacterium]